MKTIIKRNGESNEFDAKKIHAAIMKAFTAIGDITSEANAIADNVCQQILDKIKDIETLHIEQIQDMVEEGLMKSDRADVARAYIRYRYKREILRHEGTTDKTLMELLSNTNDYWATENANKNSKTVSTQRDYIAGITSTDITRRLLLPADVVNAHDNAIIHFHDCDYFAQNALHNCELINLNDMLQNGTCINGVMIEKPHRILTASTIATQIILAVSSSSYGGATITLTHLAPFIRSSHDIYYKNYINSGIDEKKAKELADAATKKEIIDATQTFNYQVNSMTSTNGQTPFLSVCMYLGETDEYKEELAQLIEEFLKQRILGFKNEKGVYITPAFPKLLYVLEEDNIHPDSKYYYLTKLAAKCTAHRMVPDYISEKVMKELKGGDVYPCMGCVEGKEVIRYKYRGIEHLESFERMWVRISEDYNAIEQVEGIDDNLYINTENDNSLFIHDTKNGFVKVKKVIRNVMKDWAHIKLSDKRSLVCTLDHPLVTSRGRIAVFDLTNKDEIYVYNDAYDVKEYRNYIAKNESQAYELGFLLTCGEDFKDVIERFGEDNLLNFFEGDSFYNLHIPMDVFHWKPELKQALIRGMNEGMDKGHLRNIRELLVQKALLMNSMLCDTDTISTARIENIIKFNKKMFAYDVETESDKFDVSGIYSHNCRSFLTPDRFHTNLSNASDYVEGKSKYYGRFNQGVVTINLPDVAFTSRGNEASFWSILDLRLELCHKALRIRNERLSKGVSDMSPILWQHGALARLKKGDSIKELLHHGYSTISLGYAGLYECVKYMTGESHTQSQKGEDFAIKVMQRLNDKCAEWKKEEDIDYSVYGTPIESVTYKFAKGLKKRFGNDIFIKLDGKDRNYITNSYHTPVFEKIGPFDKLAKESKYQKLSPGGAISYVECSSLIHNIDAVLEVIKFIYENIMYAELNIKSDYCHVCGYEGEIKIIDEDGKLDWECPICKNRDHSKMNVARRTCGYIGTAFFNQGRTNEIRDRYVHLDNTVNEETVSK